MTELQGAIIDRVNQLEGYAAKADAIETMELVLSKAGVLDEGTKKLLNQLWDTTNEMDI